jgi:uncharacterized cupin superfamily protein
VNGDKLVDAESIHFKETSPHSTFDWHNDPIPQYVITLSGVLEFTTVGGETFTIRPGDVFWQRITLVQVTNGVCSMTNRGNGLT